MYLNRKKIIFLLIAAILAMAVVAALLFKLKSPEPANEAITLNEAMTELDYSYKLLKFPFPELRQESAAYKISQSHEAWEVFMDNFQKTQPPELGRTRGWLGKMIEAKEYARKADELAQEKSENSAQIEMEKAYTIYSQIKKENNIKDRFGELSSFYVVNRKVGLAEKNEVVAAGLTDLKLIFTGLKESVDDENYRLLVARLESAILDIERLLPGPDFKKAQSNLITGAEELYWKY